MQIIDEAKQLLQRRLQHNIISDNIINSRRNDRSHRNNINSPVPNSNKFIDTRKQEIKKTVEKSNFFRMYEGELAKAYSELEENLKEINKHREVLREEILKFRQSIRDHSAKFENKKQKLKNLDKLKKSQKTAKTQNEVAVIFFRMNSFRDEINKQDCEFLEYTEEVSKEISKRNILVESLDAQISDLRIELEILKEEQIKHFFSLLSEGKDTQFEGLS